MFKLICEKVALLKYIFFDSSQKGFLSCLVFQILPFVQNYSLNLFFNYYLILWCLREEVISLLINLDIAVLKLYLILLTEWEEKQV